MTAPVIVGVDTLQTSWSAILSAAWEAQRRRAPLLLAHGEAATADSWPYSPEMSTMEDTDALAEADRMLTVVANLVRDHFADLAVQTQAWLGHAAGGLVDRARTARMLVVGARGSGGVAGLSIGSVAAQTASHAACPVIVVRPPTGEGDELPVPRPGPVVVGVDGSPVTETALAFAFDEASLRNVPLVALNSWWTLPGRNLGPAYPGTYDVTVARAAMLAQDTEEARRLLGEAIAGWSTEYPDVPVEPRSVHEMNPSSALTHASREAGLVVVGSRGRGGFAGLLLGSVGRDLVATAQGPVAVVHPR